MTVSRVQGSSYINTTGKPIAVAITGALGNFSSGFRATVSGLVILQTASNSLTYGSTSSGIFIVPPGETYSVVALGAFAGNATISSWFELR